MKSANQIAEQYERLRQYYIYKCWNGWDYTGQGEKMLNFIEETKTRYLSNIFNHFNGSISHEASTLIDKSVYSKKAAE